MPKNPRVALEVVEGHLNIDSNQGDPLQTARFLLGAVVMLLQNMSVKPQEESRIVTPHASIIPFPGGQNNG